MGNLRQVDMTVLDDIFEMGGGNVLTFSIERMSKFFAEIGVNIDAMEYCRDGGSKGKRMRCFVQTADRATVARALEALSEYREVTRRREGREEKLPTAREDLDAIIGRLTGTAPAKSKPAADRASPIDKANAATLLQDLVGLTDLSNAQARGYAFRKFLKMLFDAYELQARDAFRLQGEQIDGSFLLGTDTYLQEAKWQRAPCGAGELHAFHGKLDQKAAWARGLFISHSGFTEDGLIAFGKGKRAICMDGLDL